MSLKNLVYIGNTTSFDDQILIKYCSQFGKILSCTNLNCADDKRLFCDFRIIEFATKQQLDYFLDRTDHKLGSIILDVKLYEDLLNNFEILNLDRKIFIGPVVNPNHINIIVQFYKLIDPNLSFCLSRQGYVLIECSNRQYIRTIIQQKTIPQTFDNQIFNIHLPIHPKELIKHSEKVLSTIENKADYNNDQLLEATVVTEPISEIQECGWTSPPRAVIIDDAPSPTRLSSKPSTKIDVNAHPRVIETDVKPMKNVTNDIPQFVEQFQNEINQIKAEYQTKFDRDRTSIEYEINRLINDERIKFDKLGRYLHEQRRSSIKRKHC